MKKESDVGRDESHIMSSKNNQAKGVLSTDPLPEKCETASRSIIGQYVDKIIDATWLQAVLTTLVFCITFSAFSVVSIYFISNEGISPMIAVGLAQAVTLSVLSSVAIITFFSLAFYSVCRAFGSNSRFFDLLKANIFSLYTFLAFIPIIALLCSLAEHFLTLEIIVLVNVLMQFVFVLLCSIYFAKRILEISLRASIMSHATPIIAILAAYYIIG